MTKNMYGINNKSNSVVSMFVTTSVTHKPEVRIDLLTFMQIINNFALEPYSKLCSFHNLFVNPCVSKRPIVPGIIDFWKKFFADGQGSFGVYW